MQVILGKVRVFLNINIILYEKHELVLVILWAKYEKILIWNNRINFENDSLKDEDCYNNLKRIFKSQFEKLCSVLFLRKKTQ